MTTRYDYDKQAWIVDGRYSSCSHPPEQRTADGCAFGCYGTAHEGETAPTDTLAPPCNCELCMPAKGYDGSALVMGGRVEIHPATDLWMRGARYGTITGLTSSGTVNDRVRVKLDKLAGIFAGSADLFRAIE